jgi:hypothetical protein
LSARGSYKNLSTYGKGYFLPTYLNVWNNSDFEEIANSFFKYQESSSHSPRAMELKRLFGFTHLDNIYSKLILRCSRTTVLVQQEKPSVQDIVSTYYQDLKSDFVGSDVFCYKAVASLDNFFNFIRESDLDHRQLSLSLNMLSRRSNLLMESCYEYKYAVREFCRAVYFYDQSSYLFRPKEDVETYNATLASALSWGRKAYDSYHRTISRLEPVLRRIKLNKPLRSVEIPTEEALLSQVRSTIKSGQIRF